MYTFIAIILITLSVILAVVGIYSIYCAIGTHSFSKKVQDNGKEELNSKNKFNLAVWLIKRSKKVKNARDNEIKHVVKKKAFVAITMSVITAFTTIYGSFFSASVGIVALSLDAQATSVATVMQTLFSGDDDCQCYAKCTGNKEDDKVCTYELLFGPTEYDKLVNDMTKGIDYETAEKFKTLNDSKDATGKQKNDVIKEYINEDMVNDYKAIVGSNSKFRSDDGKDRSKMSFDELKADLYNLLCDYKVNGRNPNCDCATCSEMQFGYKCMGEEHYKKGWSWKAVWDDDNEDTTEDDSTGDDSTGDGSNTPGNATGDFALKLDDGTYYWYHQSSVCSNCKYDATDKTYGHVRDCRAGSQYQGTMAERGCSIYSTAMALSNLLDEEITPWEVIQNVLGCKVKQASDGAYYFNTDGSKGISMKGGVIVTMDALAKSIEKAYGSQGIKAKSITFNQKNIDSYLYADDKYAYVINSYQATSGFTWYKGAGHFMVLRPGSGKGKYKCFTSASTSYGYGHDNIKKGMNDEMPWSTVNAAKRHTDCVVVYRDKSYYGSSSSGSGTLTGGKVFDFTKGGNFECPRNNCMTYMGWQCTNASDSPQVAFRNKHFKNWDRVNGNKDAFDKEGFSKVDRRYVVAVTWADSKATTALTGYQKGKINTGIAKIGDKIDVYLANGEIIPCIVGEIKSDGDKTWSKWGHYAVKNNNMKNLTSKTPIVTVEFVVNKYGKYAPKWYNASGYGKHVNPGNEGCHPEWRSNVAKIVVGGKEVKNKNNKNNKNNNSSSSSNKNKNNKNNNSSSSSNKNNNSSSSSNNKNKTKGDKVVDYAKRFVGCHYKYGGTTMGVRNWKKNHNVNNCRLPGVDCSGFVLKVYEHFGYKFSGRLNSKGLRTVGKGVDFSKQSNLKPGDIICYPSHVAIYAGNGKIVHASNPEDGVKISDTWNYKTVLAVRRIYN